MPTNQFTPLPLSKQGFKLAEFLPTGKAWDAKNDNATNLGTLLFALGAEFNRLENLIKTVNTELDINFTNELIREWEISVGIPDDCFTDIINTSMEAIVARREAILVKLRHVRLQTAQDYIDLALNSFGVTITVTPGVEAGLFPLSFPLVFFPTIKEARFSIIITFPDEDSVFPLPFPFLFSSGDVTVLSCLFRKIKPANVNVIFRFTGE